MKASPSVSARMAEPSPEKEAFRAIVPLLDEVVFREEPELFRLEELPLPELEVLPDELPLPELEVLPDELPLELLELDSFRLELELFRLELFLF